MAVIMGFLALLIQPVLAENMEKGNVITLFLAGDVMTGRGIDQVLPHPGNPRLYEPYMKSALGYVELAEKLNGRIEKPVDCAYVWGDALGILDHIRPDLRIINLETAVTSSDDHWISKGIHYRMHPDNIACLVEAGIDFCSLANNHVLDWGYTGLAETLATLAGAGIKTAGAGENLQRAGAPAILDVTGKGRVIVFSYGLGSSGIPRDWGARDNRGGVNRLDDLSDSSLREIGARVKAIKKRGDVIVVSIHWGGNWGYEIPKDHIRFARKLIDDAGVDLVHGHSSHHPKALEIYGGKLILYGSGDFLNDYEGISGYEEFRSDIVLMYFADIETSGGRLAKLKMVPLKVNRFRLNQATKEEALWIKDTLDRTSEKFNIRFRLNDGNSITPFPYR